MRNKYPCTATSVRFPFCGNFHVSVLRLSYSCSLFYFCTTPCSFFLDSRQDLTSDSKRRKVLIQQLNRSGDTTQPLDSCNTFMKQIQEGKAQSRFYEYLPGQWECPETELKRMEKNTRPQPLKISMPWSSESPDSPVDPLPGPTEWNKPHYSKKKCLMLWVPTFSCSSWIFSKCLNSLITGTGRNTN